MIEGEGDREALERRKGGDQTGVEDEACPWQQHDERLQLPCQGNGGTSCEGEAMAGPPWQHGEGSLGKGCHRSALETWGRSGGRIADAPRADGAWWRTAAPRGGSYPLLGYPEEAVKMGCS